ncbi:MAG: hypothetical protein QGH25_08050, partial [Candidatus Latescibacteria bacterium]|nr:hypothetical protein [Candidatus Latescibacterota bacterium]
MALTVEDGTGLAAAESYVSVAAADTYHTENTDDDADWTGADTAAKEAALRQATVWLDSEFTWKGAIKREAQALGWPRTGATDFEDRAVDEDSIPAKLEDACAHLALYHLET